MPVSDGSVHRARRHFVAHLAGAAAVLVVAIWLSTGTMAPYAATAQHPRILEPCHYLINVDHHHFTGVSAMIAGEAPEQWAGSVVLRRLLFPIVAHPLIRTAGFMAGGVTASVVIHVVALLAFGEFVRRRIGERAAVATVWLLATYPGVTYWAGLPYSYVTIVPGSLFGLMLLYGLWEAPSLRDALRPALLLGVLFTAYDFAPFFGLAALLLLIARRRMAWGVAAAVVMVVPMLLVFLMLLWIEVPVLNSNTAGYLTIASAYLHPGDLHLWLRYLAELPLVLVSNFIFGNLIFIPILFSVAALIAVRRRIDVLSWPEKALLIAALTLFVFNNAAPPYHGWQLRGQWIARLYQPVFPALLIFAARVTQYLSGADLRRWTTAVALVVVANASIAFGPVLMNPLAAYAYHRFYVHSPPESLLINLRRFGRRPLGFCNRSHRWEDIPNPNTPFNRPEFMYRYDPDRAGRPR